MAAKDDRSRYLASHSAFVYGTARFTTVSDGGMGVASFTTIIRSSIERLTSGGTTSFATVSDGGKQLVSSPGTAVRTTLDSGGGEFGYDGGTAKFTAVSIGGFVTVSFGIMAYSTIANSGGYEACPQVGRPSAPRSAAATSTFGRAARPQAPP